MLTNFQTEVEENDVDVIISNIKDYGIELIGVSDTVQYSDTEKLSGCHFTQNTEKEDSQSKSEEIFSRMTEQINGACLCHIEHVESQLMYYQRKAKKPFPWNAALTIGSAFRINISGYVFVKEELAFEPFKTECFEANTITKMTTTYTRNNEEIEKPDEQDIVTAFMYGGEICPVDEETKYEGGKKCLACIAFCKKTSIPPQFYCGDGCHLVVPQKSGSEDKSTRIFACLVEAMHNTGYDMIARKVYRDNVKPHLVLLSPKITKKGGKYLSLVELPYAEDIVYTQFPSLRSEKYQTSDEQAAAVNELIKSMNLMNAHDDDSGVVEFQVNLNPIQQHMCNVVAYRALNPGNPLPPFNEELKKLFDVPEKIKKESRKAMEELSKLFKLEIVKERTKKPFGQKSREVTDTPMETDENELNNENYRGITKIGTITPAEDFMYLVKNSLERFSNLCDQIQQIIFEYMFKTTIDYGEKIKEAMLGYREMAKIHGPFQYNKWIQELKEISIKRNKIDEWNDIVVKEGLGLISVNESPISTLSIEEQLEFYEIIPKNMTVATEFGADAEIDDLEALLG